MGQKVHPVGFRLGFNMDHHSFWFAPANKYAILLAQDRKIRTCIRKYVKEYFETSLKYGGIARINLKFDGNLLTVELLTAFPSLFADKHTEEENNSNINQDKDIEQTNTRVSKVQSGKVTILKERIQSILDRDNLNIDKVKIYLIALNSPFSHAAILAENLTLQIENRVPFKKIIKKAIQFAKESKIKGIKIQISGRLNGAEIARIQWFKYGRIPLHTLKAKVDYFYCPAQTLYGTLGIKVWILREKVGLY